MNYDLKNHMVKDCLHNLSLSENLNTTLTKYNERYYYGLVVGLVSGLMAITGLGFIEVRDLYILPNLPKDLINSEVINSWLGIAGF